MVDSELIAAYKCDMFTATSGTVWVVLLYRKLIYYASQKLFFRNVDINAETG